MLFVSVKPSRPATLVAYEFAQEVMASGGVSAIARDLRAPSSPLDQFGRAKLTKPTFET